MLYETEDISKKEKRFIMLDKMLRRYKNTGGFGIFNIDSMLGTDIKCGDINAMMQQEDAIIDMYNTTYDNNITRNVLEKKYLGRSCVSVDARCKYGISPEYVGHRGEDRVAVFLRMNSINGHNRRVYWKEKEIDKKRFCTKMYESYEPISKPMLHRSYEPITKPILHRS
jgi:hypothetical protein